MNKEKERKRKLAHILTVVIENENLNKTDLRRITGYGNSTITTALQNLIDDDLLKVKSYKDKNYIIYNKKIVIAGVSKYKSKLHGRIMTLSGEVIGSAEKEVDDKSSLADAITMLLEGLLSGIENKLIAIGIAITTKDTNSLKNVLSLRFCVPIYVMDNLGAIAMHQRYKVEKNNNHLLVLYIDEKVRCAKIMDDCEWIELGSLLSPIISAKRGRLHYNDVLSIHTVKSRINSAHNKIESLFESSVFEKCLYSKQVKYALGELLLLLDKTVKPKSIIVAGDYIQEELIAGSLATLCDNVKADILCLGSGSKEIIEGAPCIALNDLLYY